MQSLAQENGIEIVTEFGLNTDLPTQSTSAPTPGSANISDINCVALEVRWLPSMPLLNKRNTPSIAGIGILYSEEFDRVLHAFETENLNLSINSCSRQQAGALAQDPTCRICWYESGNRAERKRLLSLLADRVANGQALAG